jgi:nitrogenase delta subunit
MDQQMKDKVEQLVDYIMKHCLWQFHSRSWDRERQNEGVLTKAMQILCNEPVENDTPAERCLWVDAVSLVDAYSKRYPWLAAMDKTEIKTLMQNLRERIDYLTITGSLNAELTDVNY